MRNFLLLLTLTVLAAPTVLDADTAAGKAVYDRACKSCHGADGTANPAIAKAMNVAMKDLKSPDVQARSDADLKKIVTNGIGKMQPIKSVTAKQLDDVVAYTRSLK